MMSLIKLSYCKKTLNIDGNACQTMVSVSMTPWAIKGAIGVVSDAYPLFGYHKASYIIGAAVLGTLAFTALATTPMHSAALAAILLLLANLEVATCDLLCEGKYSELMQVSRRPSASALRPRRSQSTRNPQPATPKPKCETLNHPEPP